jgi:FkbM family methyltransferase
MKDLANRLVRRVSGSDRAVRAAVLVRNQCQMLIGYHFAASADSTANGEQWLLGRIAGRVETFIDVGANVGAWSESMLARNPGARGIAVEPGAAALARLRDRLGGRLEIVEAACADVEGEGGFLELAGASELSSLAPGPGHGNGATRTVPVTTVDSLMASAGIEDLDFLKIDAEGFDGRVLAGASRAIGDRRIAIVQFEYNRPWAQAGSTLGHELDRLADAGYRTHALRPSSLAEVEYDRFGEFFSYSNFVAISERGAGWLR